MLTVNKADLSGTVTELHEDMLVFRQKVGGKMDSSFCLYLPAAVRKDVQDLQLKPGDEILVQNAQLYEKKGQIIMRITEVAQLAKLNSEPDEQDYFMGEISAQERFI